MKKKLALILALVLCVAVVFTFVACKPDDTDKDKPVATVTDAQAEEAISALKAYAELWVINNAIDTYDQNTELKSALTPKAKIDNGTTSVPGLVRVAYASQQYSVEVTWGIIVKTFTVAAMVADWGEPAGKPYQIDDEEEGADVIIVEVYNAFIATIEDAKAKGKAIENNGIGFNAKAYLVAGYGVGHENIDLALQVKGNIGTTDAATQLAVEILNGTDVVYGLYFKGAETKADCKIYLRSGTNYIYLDYANVVGMITDLIGYEPPALAAEEITTDDLDAIADGMISMVLGVLFANGGVKAVVGDVTTYQLMLDLGSLIEKVQSLLSVIPGIGASLNEIISGVLPPPLNQIDIESIQGIAGQLVITVLTKGGLVTDAEIALNMPKRDFRFSNTDTVSKVYGPLNFAAGLEGFNIGAQTNVVPTITGAEYFSPLNINFTGDVEIKAVDKEGEEDEILVDSIFNFALVTDINPFNLGVAKGSFIITELKQGEIDPVNFITLTYDQATGDGFFIYKDEIFDTINAIEIYEYIKEFYGEDIEDFVKDFILKMMNEFEEEEIVLAEEEGGLDIMALITSFGSIQDWYEALVTANKVSLEINKEDMLASVIDVSIVTADLNALVGVINGIGLLPTIPTLEQPESIEVYFNTEEFEDIFYVKVVVEEVDYVFEIDGSNWTLDKEVFVSFAIDEVEWVRVKIAYTESAAPAVKVVDAASSETITVTVDVYMGLDDDDDAIYDVYELAATVTKNAAGVLNGFEVTFTSEDDSFYTVYGEGVAIWTYAELAGILDLDFTFEDVPHYGFGFDSDFFSLDVDMDNFELNWGGANADIDAIPEGVFVDCNDDVIDIIEDILRMFKIVRVK
ncbi:MAG: hypothetical protein EOM87_00615 [Clostridia bacterium]|nr:hypothetical protein [Clostridia bacterium]